MRSPPAGSCSTVSSATAAFTAGDTGKTYTLASMAGAVTTGTLTYVSSTSCTMSTAAGGAMTGARFIWGTDDTAAWQAALNAAVPGQTVDCDSSGWRSLIAGHLSVPNGVRLGATGRGPFGVTTNPVINLWGPPFVIIQDNTTSTFTLNFGSNFGDFIVYSANQVPPTAATPTVFTPTITIAPYSPGCYIGKPLLCNAYIGILIQGGRHLIDSPQIGGLLFGITLDYVADFVSIRRAEITPQWRYVEGMAVNPPTAGSLDEYNLTNGAAVYVQHADNLVIDELVVYQNLVGLQFADSADTGETPRYGYGQVGILSADLVKYGIYASSTSAVGVLVNNLLAAGNNSGVGPAGDYAVKTATGGVALPKVVIKSWSLWGTFAGGNSSAGAGTTLIVPATNPG